MSKTIIDVRGLSCPEPLLAFTDGAGKPGATEVEIRFDCEAARDTISRAAASMGWAVVSARDETDCTVMHLVKNA